MTRNDLGKTEKELIEVRKKKISKLRDFGVDPYPSKSDKEYTAKRILEIKNELIASSQEIAFAGRVMAIRGHGGLIFADLSDESGKIQTVLKEDLLKDQFKLISLLDIGDFLQVSGPVFITSSGEISIEGKKIKILTKSIRPLPNKWQGMADEEKRFRKRYLDILLDPELKKLFYQKAKFWQTVRNFLLEKKFLEVETPVLEVTTGGADANPFCTTHDALGIDLYLRISMGELWQKRLMVAGFEKTFEIGRQFRNEGTSREHLQDYTQMEFYWAYANYENSMDLCEELYKFIAKEVFEKDNFEINGHQVNMNRAWDKIDYTKTLKDKIGIDVLTASVEQLKKKIKDLKLINKKGNTRGRMIDTLWKSIRGDITGPAFLINHPVEVSPLAKRSSKNSRLAERFQIIIAGSELGNGYSELNDPIDQRERFLEQAKMRQSGDTEAQMNDEDFVEALEYGMPPATGFGMSERVFSFFSGRPIKETVMFPLIRPKQ